MATKMNFTLKFCVQAGCKTFARNNGYWHLYHKKALRMFLYLDDRLLQHIQYPNNQKNVTITGSPLLFWRKTSSQWMDHPWILQVRWYPSGTMVQNFLFYPLQRVFYRHRPYFITYLFSGLARKIVPSLKIFSYSTTTDTPKIPTQFKYIHGESGKIKMGLG